MNNRPWSWPVPISLPWSQGPRAPKLWAMAKKEMTHQHTVWVTAFKAPASKSSALMVRRVPASRWVPEIISRRPTLSKR